jgi:uncharacterized secreted protein with C-terminal beta-propeller domain
MTGRSTALVALLAISATFVGEAVARSSAQVEAAGVARKAARLVQFGSCGQMLGYVKPQAARLVGPYGFGGGAFAERGGIPMGVPAAAAPARTAGPQQGVDYSGTNVQEEGVDEPDLVKTNGTTLFTVAGGRLHSVEVSDPRPRLLDTLKLEGGWSHELLLHGDKLLALSRGGHFIEPLPGRAASMPAWMPAESVLTEIDVSNPQALKIVRTLRLDGSYVAARLVGSSVRIVVASQVPAALPFKQPDGTSPAALAAAEQRNEAVIASSKVGSWLPSYRIKRPGRAATARRPVVQCRHVRRPPEFSGLGMLTVLTVDLAKGLEPVSSTAVMTDARIVYASRENLYVATERWDDRPDPAAPTEEQNGVSTAIHRFDISSPQRAQYRGSGRVSGYLLSQWSLSEYRGVLRVVSTETPAWWGRGGDSESYLTTLRQQDGALVQAGRIGGLGKGERVYAVRFVGDVGYVVTFRQIDPLYTIDLSNPDMPRVLGELKIPGYSAYLHPIGEDLLLGVGQDATEEGRPLGTQLSVFDVSDLRRPTRLHKASLGLGWSEAESDHHAFLYWPRTGTVVLPFEQRAVAFRVGRVRGIDELGRIDHSAENDWAAGIRRSLVVRDSVLTVSEAGVMASSLATLAERGWAGFPPPDSPKPQP